MLYTYLPYSLLHTTITRRGGPKGQREKVTNKLSYKYITESGKVRTLYIFIQMSSIALCNITWAILNEL